MVSIPVIRFLYLTPKASSNTPPSVQIHTRICLATSHDPVPGLARADNPQPSGFGQGIGSITPAAHTRAINEITPPVITFQNTFSAPILALQTIATVAVCD